MSLKEKKDKQTIRKKGVLPEAVEKEMFLYGKLKKKKKAVAYCELHKCYLDAHNIKERRCNKKRCKRKKEI